MAPPDEQGEFSLSVSGRKVEKMPPHRTGAVDNGDNHEGYARKSACIRKRSC
jgi:hypothetical protein